MSATGAAVIVRKRKRGGSSVQIRYLDAADRMVYETLGTTPEWTRRKAKQVLADRVQQVRKEGYRRPERISFGALAEEWLATYPEQRSLKRSTRSGYTTIVNVLVRSSLGKLEPHDVTVERVERFIAEMAKQGLAAGSINRRLNVISLVLKLAKRRGLINEWPMPSVMRPREQRREWTILGAAEVAAMQEAFRALISEADTDRDRDDLLVASRLFTLHMGTGMRRGEAAGLRWRCVNLADPDGAYLTVAETFVRNATDSPKSRAGCRRIDLGQRVAAMLFEHRGWSAYDGDDELVFPNPRTGTPFDAARYGELMRLAQARAGIPGPLRPSHDLRHSAITAGARAGTPPTVLMARSGHASFQTTLAYVHLAGERFGEAADLLEAGVFGAPPIPQGEPVSLHGLGVTAVG